MKTICECGHSLSQHPERGRCDYSGYACNCNKYKRLIVEDGTTNKFGGDTGIDADFGHNEEIDNEKNN